MFGIGHSFSYFTFLKSLGIGYLIGTLYIIFKLIRLLGLKQAPVVFIQDILFFSISSVVIFLCVFEINAGIFRFYIISAIVMGFLLFYLVPGSFVKKLPFNKNSKEKRNYRVKENIEMENKK